MNQETLKFYYVKLGTIDTTMKMVGRFEGVVSTVFTQYEFLTSNENVIKSKLLEIYNDTLNLTDPKQYSNIELIECEIIPKIEANIKEVKTNN